MGRVKQIWYLSPMRAAKVQASLRIRAVSPEPPLLAHTGSESRGTFRQKARSLAPLNGVACAVKICHGGMLEDTNSLDGAHIIIMRFDHSFSLILAAAFEHDNSKCMQWQGHKIEEFCFETDIERRVHFHFTDSPSRHAVLKCPVNLGATVLMRHCFDVVCPLNCQ